MATTLTSAPNRLPRLAITYCTGCRWMLRAAYFAQELLSTFGNTIGEVALIPATGGTFQVHLTYCPLPVEDGPNSEGIKSDPIEVLLWDRKTEGGFPETKILKQKVRNAIEPGRSLGHSDKPSSEKSTVVIEHTQSAEGSRQSHEKFEPKGAESSCIDCN